MTGGERNSRARRRTAKEHGPDTIDLHVGRRLRLGRELAGLTQTGIGQSLGMSFQVVQKYEQGEIRVSASRLYQLARLLERPVEYFFAGVESSAGAVADASLPGALAEDGGPAGHGIARREIELVRAFRAIGSPEVQQRLLSFLRNIADNPPE